MKFSFQRLILGCLLCVLCLFGTAHGEIKIRALDVGQGDCVLIQSDTHNVLIDAGWDFDKVRETLQDKGVSNIDVVIGTHGHADHIGGLVGVLQRNQVDTVMYNGQTHTSKTFEYFVDAVIESGAQYHEPSRGEIFELGDIRLEILHPEGSAADYTGHLHEKNIATRVVYGDFAIIVSGDLEKHSEKEILAAGTNVSAQVLELGHHGSRTSTSREWLEAVEPEFAFYQAGQHNQYGHPHSETIALLKSQGIKVMGTDVHGNIVITAHEDGAFSVQSGTDSAMGSEMSGDCIDLNSASKDELLSIVHIGPGRAGKIIEMRPWANIRELTRIHGIGQGRLGDIKKQGLVCE